MQRLLRIAAWRAKYETKNFFKPLVGRLAVFFLRAIRRADRARVANWAGGCMRRIGPWLPEHRIGRANLAAAFPEKPPAEIEKILRGAWDNLGRVAAEFAFLDQMRILYPGDSAPADAVYDKIELSRFDEIRTASRPTAFFAAHLANWELPALAAARFGVDSSVLYRAPSIPGVADAVLAMRKNCMGTLVRSGFDAPLRLAHALETGIHVGMLVDQHESRGVAVTFFGRTCKVNPLLAQLARHTECFIRGFRVVRLPDGNHFWGEVTDPLDLPRDAQGCIDVQRTMQTITSVIEGWVREHPEQWLWQHRRWR
jgi:Kdo2-lipid IVA lauroyltransferase/acyltransferase